MRSLPIALLLLAGLATSHAFDLLDPSTLVQELSQHSAGLEKWRRPEFCGCVAAGAPPAVPPSRLDLRVTMLYIH